MWNTTSTACRVNLCRLSTTGTKGTAITPAVADATSIAASVTAANGHTVAPTLADLFVGATLGAAVGSGAILTFGGDVGITCNVGTTNGLGLFVPTGTGQVIDFLFVWDE